MTTRSLHTPGDFDFFRRGSDTRGGTHYASDRSFPLSIAPPARPMESRICPVARRGNSPPSRDTDNDNGSGQARRRVAVAVSCISAFQQTRDCPMLPTSCNTRMANLYQCARCRKRKIRCSGDPGDSSGCQNCKAAGADISECKFNRVLLLSFGTTGKYSCVPRLEPLKCHSPAMVIWGTCPRGLRLAPISV